MIPSRRALVGVLLGVVVAVAFPYAVRGEAPQVGDYAAVQNTDGDGVRLRSGIWSEVVRNLPEGTPALVLAQDSDQDGATWFQVEAAGSEGWVYGSYLEQISQEEAEQRQASSRGGLRSTAADIAVQYVGYRYVWGGTSPQTGFDSSGFLYYVYKAMGVPIPRDYWGMLAQGQPVTLNQLLPGDLLFFVNTYKAGLSHGGVYIGNGRFVHAVDERRGVAIDSIWSDYYIYRYYAARRML